MKRKWLKIAVWLLLTPVILFVTLMILLYAPPVQNFIRQKATALASEATGMDISVRRIDLRFPLNLLVSGVQVVQQADTLLTLERLNVHVQARPLFRGQVEVDAIAVEQAAVNSAGLLEGMSLRGTLGSFLLESHGVDLIREEVILNNVALADTRLQVTLADTTATAADTTATDLRWRAVLHALRLDNVAVELDMPLDSMRLSAKLGQVRLEEAVADLKEQLYGWQRFDLSDASLGYDSGTGQPASGFDASHVALSGLRLGVDSVFYQGRNMKAVIRELALSDRSGLSVTSLTGTLQADSAAISVPALRLLTPHSEINLSAHTYWELVDMPTTGNLTVRLDARIGKQDVMLLAGEQPEEFRDAYPSHPLVIRAGTDGNFSQLQLSRFAIDLPGAFSLHGEGVMHNLTDSLARKGSLKLEMLTQNLNFLTGLAGLPAGGSVVVPDSMKLKAQLGIEGPRYEAHLHLRERQGAVNLNAGYHAGTEAYRAELAVRNLQLHDFLPQDSIYHLSARLSASGQGTDFSSHRTNARLHAWLEKLEYGPWDVSGVDLKAGLRSALATVKLTSDNDLLRMQTEADLRLDRRYLDGRLDLNVDQVDLYRLNVAPRPLRRPFAFHLGAEARRDSIKLGLEAGDLGLRFRARSTLKELIEQGSRFADVLARQIEERRLDHAELRRMLPSAGMHLDAGQENPVSYYLATKDITFHDFKLGFGFTPELGINGRTAVHGLRMDSLQLDTIFFSVKQDTSLMRLQGGVVNGPDNPQFVFRSTLTGEIRSEDAELRVGFIDEQGDTGVLLGLNARPLTEGHGKGNGVLFNVTPAEPVLAFRKFHFVEGANWLYLHKDMRLYANVDMSSDDGLRFRMQSNQQDTVSLQNMNIELRRLQLAELSRVLPYMPHVSGLFSAEAQYVQTPTSLQLSAEADVRSLTYERKPVGDVGLGATWLPGEGGKHYLSTYLSFDGEEVLTADGMLLQGTVADSLNVETRLADFPMKVANVFVPDGMVTLAGRLNGDMLLSGTMEKPRVDGELSMDSVSVFARQAGARYWMDNRPVRIDNNRLLLDKFAIYTTSNNPFTIDGNVDFRNLERPTADLSLKAANYTLLDAPRTRESLVYGKVLVDFSATARGPLDALTMRGNMHLLGDTDVTYVLTDSPLTVEDRLDGLVSFVSFNDTTALAAEEAPVMSLGGLNMIMTVSIDNAVRLRADLTPDRSNYVELEGGGTLTLQYTPQGDMNLNGRYTLSEGVMKYSFSIIPLKEFQLANGGYVDWRGDPMNPTLNLKATERVRASVASDDNGSRTVNFDVSIAIKNNLSAPELTFDLAAPDDATVENELQAMSPDERSKQAITMMATGIYLNSGVKGGGLTMGAALNSVLQSQINALAGSVKNASISVGIEDRTAAETGDTQKDISFRYSQRFFNDRVQIVIGGKVSTGANATNDVESFIDNISLEYRLDASGTRYVRVFHDKNYESVLDGEVTETGLGLVMRKKLDRLSELFIFRKKKVGPTAE